MNPYLDLLQPYPFERMNVLKQGLVSRGSAPHIALSIGEPKHPAPQFLVDALTDPTSVKTGLGLYPATRGSDSLRSAIATWATRRFELAPGTLTSARHVLPVSGTREALFSFAQALLTGGRGSYALLPNPFYRIP